MVGVRIRGEKEWREMVLPEKERREIIWAKRENGFGLRERMDSG